MKSTQLTDSSTARIPRLGFSTEAVEDLAQSVGHRVARELSRDGECGARFLEECQGIFHKRTIPPMFDLDSLPIF